MIPGSARVRVTRFRPKVHVTLWAHSYFDLKGSGAPVAR